MKEDVKDNPVREKEKSVKVMLTVGMQFPHSNEVLRDVPFYVVLLLNGIDGTEDEQTLLNAKQQVADELYDIIIKNGRLKCSFDKEHFVVYSLPEDCIFGIRDIEFLNN